MRRYFKVLFLIGSFLAAYRVDAAEKLIADYGGHAGFQSATWVGRDLGIFEKHGLDVEIIMITGAARSVAALLGNSTHFSTGSATGPLAAAGRTVAWRTRRGWDTGRRCPADAGARRCQTRTRKDGPLRSGEPFGGCRWSRLRSRNGRGVR